MELPANVGTASDESEGETIDWDMILEEEETLRLEMRAAVVTLLVFGKPGDICPVDDIKPVYMKRLDNLHRARLKRVAEL